MAIAEISAAVSELARVRVDLIDRNPDNPRIHFRQGEMEQLLDSIQRLGVQVPITLYRAGRRFVLIDGERRWRCALKLGLETIPALIETKPTPLQNLLLMFNIHSLREQWDLVTQALKLTRVIEMLTEEEGAPPTERELSIRTGLSRATIRRCKLLLNLPDRYLQIILVELEKPKSQQKYTEDFFIEMERSLTAVQRHMPELIQDEREKDTIRRVLIDKYKQDIIPSRIHFRKISKIARAAKVDADQTNAAQVLSELFKKNSYSIERAYDDSVSEAYTERDVVVTIDGLVEKLRSLHPTEIDEEVRASLEQLIEEARKLLERARQ
jgi:ParB/RepB/Spo0J family partition protein